MDGETKTKLLSSRIEPTKQLVDLINASQIKPKKFINASAVGFYGDCADQLIDENKSVGNDFLAEICVKWEEQAKLIEQSQTDFIILRIGVVLDAKEGALPRMVLPFKIFAGGKLASGRQWVPWIHIDDLVSIFRYLITTPGTSGVYNATAPNPVTNSQLTASIAKILRRPAWFPVPTFALKIALGEQAMLVLNGQRVIPDKLIKAGHPFQFSEIDTALMDILKVNADVWLNGIRGVIWTVVLFIFSFPTAIHGIR